ncbi:MAG TPA: hypothetical protein VGW10_00580 [Solirubrobacteraceae bacterium]|nr:hypothetical protein [Solirubrobacteraceae bacterium]
MRQRLAAASSPLVALGLAVAGLTAYVLTIALDTTAYLNDEYANVIVGRGMARDPGEILSASGGGLFRGPERLTSVLLAIPDAVFASAPAQMRAGHVLLALAYALVAVPAYALLRGLDVPRWPAVALAVAAAAGPWLVFGTTMLNVTIAAPLTILFVWAAWRAIVRPSVPAEVLAVAIAALMTTARASHVAFFAGAALAAVAAAWWTRAEGEGLARLPRRILSRTPVIAGVTLLGLVIVVVLGPERFAGDAYDQSASLTFPVDRIWASLGWTTAVLGLATGFVALPIGGAWALRQLVTPTDVRTGTFAVLAVSLVFLYAYVAGAAGAQEQERYPAVLGALPLIALGAALFRREVWLLGTAIVGLVAARATATRGIAEATEPLSYFFEPAQLFFSKVVIGRLTVALPADDQMVTIATVGIAVLAVAIAALAARRAVAAGTVAAVLALALVTGVYTVEKYEPATAPGDLEEVAWLDRAVDGETSVFWNYHWSINAADRDVRTRQTLYHNESACCGEWRPEFPESVPADGRLERDPEPTFVAGHDIYRPVVFAARQVARPKGYGHPMRLERFVDGPRAAAHVRGAGPDGAVEDAPARIEAYPALRGHCLDVVVTAPADASGPVGYALGPERGSVAPGGKKVVRADGGVPVRRTGDVDAPLVLGEIYFVGCDDPPSVAP